MAKTASRVLSYEQALQRAASLCCSSEHCVSDINEKLYKWGVSKSDAEKVVTALLDEKYIDESRYAAAYVNDKVRFSHWGKVKIRAMLRMQHIAVADIEEALGNVDPEEYHSVLVSVISAKRRSLGGDDDYASRAKIVRFALQRGFEMHEITKIISEY